MSTPDSIRDIADTVLFEGYMLYPYRANDAKNTVRWQFGVLAPEAFVAVDPSERSFLRGECLLEGRNPSVSVRARFLQLQRRTVERGDGDGFVPVESLDVGDATFLPWDEAVVHDFEVSGDFEVPGGVDVEEIDGGRLVRMREPLAASLDIETEPLPGPYFVRRLRLTLRNRTPSTARTRAEALAGSLLAAHLVVSVRGGRFVSMIDPPEWATGYAGACENVGGFPVLVGEPGTRDTMLVSPIILYDYPQVAPESEARFCDATEIDEMLTLRALTLTDQEKRQVRGSDPRGDELMDQLDHLQPELLGRLHGAIRSMTATARRAAPDDEASVMIGGVCVHRGVQVRLRPGARTADAQDMFLAGRTATVAEVIDDVDGGCHLAVTLDDLEEFGHNPHGRFLYFAPDEVEPCAR